MKNIFFTLMLCTFLIALCGCQNTENNATAIQTETTAQTDETENQLAESNETAPVQRIDTAGLMPIYASDLKDGVYNIKVDSSSSMFNIESCELTVSEGKMTAVMTMGGKGYLYIFMGKGENARESEFIYFSENENGEHTYTVPVEALDMEIECSAFSKAKEKWYDRTLIFRADSLPVEAFGDGVINTAETLGLSDGEYTVNVTLDGGSGRAKIESPAKLTVEDGKAYAEIVWGSSNYDYMTVNGERFDLISTDGNSAFKIPVAGFDFKMPVTADTTAMSTPYEIEYTLYFDSGSIKP